MKNFKLGRSILATLLASSMVLANCVMPVAAEGTTIKYVSLGDSMTNGYGLEGYNGNNGVEDYGISYANKFAEWLVSAEYAETVEHAQLAMSGCRAEDLHWLLEFDHESEEMRDFVNSLSDGWDWNEEEWYSVFDIGDYRTHDDMCEDRDRCSAAASNILASGYDSPYATAQQKAEAMCVLDGTSTDPDGNYVHYTNHNQVPIVAEYLQTAIKEANIVSMAVGNSNFGTFMFDQIVNAVGYNGGTPESAMRFSIERALTECPPELKEEVLALLDELYAAAGEHLGVNLNYDAGAEPEDNMMAAIANAAVYAGISYVLNYAGSVDAILKLNPDVEIIQIALMNTYLSTDSNVTEHTIGSLLEVIFPPLNAFIAALPTYMQFSGNEIYDEATFYYAEAPEVACMVEVYGSDFYNLDGTTNPDSITRQRFFRDLMGIIRGMFGDRDSFGAPLDYSLTFGELLAYDDMDSTAKAAYAYANRSKAITCAVYLAFEKATIDAGKEAPVTLSSIMGLGDMEVSQFAGVLTKLNEKMSVSAPGYAPASFVAIAEIFNDAALNNYGLISEVTNLDVLQVYGAEDGEKLTIAEGIAQSIADDSRNSAIIEQMADAGLNDSIYEAYFLASPYSSYYSNNYAMFKLYGGDNYTTFVNTVRAGAIATAKTTIVNESANILVSAAGNTESLCRLLALPNALGESMAEDDKANSWFGLTSRCVIGDGLGGHPSAGGHEALFNAVKSAYGEKYTAKDETVENLKAAGEVVKDYILEYYDEAYAYAYAQADANGYVDIAADAIDKAINVVTTLDFEDVEMTDEFRAELAAELAAVVATLEEVKAVLAEDKASDVNGLVEAVLALQDDLYTHLAKAGEILAQAGNDVNELAVPVVEAYVKDVIIPVIDAYAKAVIEAYFGIADFTEEAVAKTTHKKYVADEDSYYVALGGKTVLGTGLTYPNNIPYYGLVAEELGIPNVAGLGNNNLLPSGVYDYVTTNAEEIANADFITYQTDASAFIYALLYETPDWNKYIDAETQELISDIIEKTTEVLETNWSEYTNAQVSEIIADVKAKVLESVSEYDIVDGIVEKAIDGVIELVVPYISDAAAELENKKNDAYAPIASLDEEVKEYAEKLAYSFVAYAVDTVKAVEAIQTINPEAVVYIVGMYNPLNGLEIVTDDTTIDAGEIFDYVIKATNLYYTGYAVANGKVAFVDVSETETFGSGTELEIDATNIDLNSPGAILGLINGIERNMLANATGHAYIKDQIVAATKCDYSVYEAIDEDTHALKCALCGDVKETEAHDFGEGTVCTKCGYEKEVVATPEPTATPAPVYGGGGSSVSRYTVKFDTNGGSKIANVLLKKGEVLAKPADPTKDGYVFDGWYTDKELTAAYDFSQPVTKSFTLYAKWGMKFTDLDKNAWYYDYVKTIVEKGLMNGISETEFAPDMELTRGMFVTILNRIEGEAKAEGELVFTDVAADAYYAEAIKWANANGIVKGISETEFAPDANVTREQMAAMIARYAEFKKIEVTAEGEVVYTDSDSISEYAKEAVVTAKHLGLLIGNDDGSFAPQRNTTRAEAAALFVRLLGVIEK